MRILVSDAVRGAADALSERGNAVAAHLLSQADELNRALGERSSQLSTLIGTDGGALVQAIEDRAQDLTTRVSEVHTAILEAITVKGRETADTFARKGLETTRALVDAGDSIIAALDDRSSSAAEILNTTKVRLEEDISGILDRLNHANGMLNDVLESAGENLGKVETNLSRSAGEFRTAVDRAVTDTGRSTDTIGEQVGLLRDVSTTVLADITALASRLDDQGRQLTEAARHLDETNNSVSIRVTERRTAIEDVADTLLAKTEAVDNLMRSFATQLTETLESADDKTREVTGMLASAAEAATKAVTEQFESMRMSAGLEGQKAREAVRAAEDDIVSEMSRMLGEASERFTEATSRMRDVARDVHRELEATRAELKRGVLDLPEEAEASTSALRKVISEQVRALGELSEIVSKQSNTLDVSRNGNGVQQAAVASTQTRAAPAPTPPPAPSATIAEPAPARQPVQPQIRGDLRRTTLSDFEQPKSEGEQSPQGKGWVSDLLRRASRNEGQGERENGENAGRSPLHMVESLNSLSMDIARAIDHETFLDLWDRYKRGERHVFTRRLYTLQGQQTFDEIRQKFARDPEFRDAVDRYIRDFEQLLSQVSRNDRDNMLGQTYLTSDTGKVYTMLAHASGRLD